jgi:L-ascorbate metabolism protein UlaG (beta-lactamase superfamily)
MLKSLGSRAAGLRLERMQASPQWQRDVGGFRNSGPVRAGLRDPEAKMPTLSDFVCGGTRRVPSKPLPAVDPRPAWQRPPEAGLRATWLLEIDGARLLTDPVWGSRASPSQLAGPKRFQPVPVSLKDLPPLDAVLISHDHYDHLCLPTMRALAKTALPFVTSLGVGAHLQGWGIAPERITELDWWESAPIAGGRARVTAAPSQHFSGRGIGSRNTTAWSSFAVQGSRHGFFFSGDTGLTTEYSAIRERLGVFDVVALEVGAFHPAWGDIHLGPENALQAFELLGGKRFLPVHWGTFNLAMHDWDDPAETLLRLGGGVPLLMPELGAPSEPSRTGEPRPWWRHSGQPQALPPAAESEPALDPNAPIAWPLD